MSHEVSAAVTKVNLLGAVMHKLLKLTVRKQNHPVPILHVRLGHICLLIVVDNSISVGLPNVTIFKGNHLIAIMEHLSPSARRLNDLCHILKLIDYTTIRLLD